MLRLLSIEDAELPGAVPRASSSGNSGGAGSSGLEQQGTEPATRRRKMAYTGLDLGPAALDQQRSDFESLAALSEKFNPTDRTNVK